MPSGYLVAIPMLQRYSAKSKKSRFLTHRSLQSIRRDRSIEGDNKGVCADIGKIGGGPYGRPTTSAMGRPDD